MDKEIVDPYKYDSNDSELWVNLLRKARGVDINLYAILMFLRDVGATLVPDQKYNYVIKPIIDPDGVKGWLDKEQYENESHYLVPYKLTVIELLKEL